MNFTFVYNNTTVNTLDVYYDMQPCPEQNSTYVCNFIEYSTQPLLQMTDPNSVYYPLSVPMQLNNRSQQQLQLFKIPPAKQYSQ